MTVGNSDRRRSNKTTADPEKILVRKKAVQYIHDEIKERYQLKNIRKIPNQRMNGYLRDITQEDIDLLEELFLTTIYPDLDARRERDKSFESLINMLKNPHKLIYIIPSLPLIALRHASVFPIALSIGLHSVMAYTRSLKLEDKLVNNLLDIFARGGKTVTPSLEIKHEEYLQAYRTVGYEEGKKMIDLSTKVIDAGKRTEVVDSAKEILSDVKDALKRVDEQNRRTDRKEVYTNDIQAIEYGIQTLKKISSTFEQFSSEKIERLMKISRTVEMHYLNQNYGRL